MRDNVGAIDAVLMSGESMIFGELSDNATAARLTGRQQSLIANLLDLGRREASEITKRFPDLMRRVGGYNIDALMPGGVRRGPWSAATTAPPPAHPNLAHLLVGSDGTLAFSTRIQIDQQPVAGHKVLAVRHVPRL